MGLKRLHSKKYGETCEDIQCLPGEICIIAKDECESIDVDGTTCGKYPICDVVTKTEACEKFKEHFDIILEAMNALQDKKIEEQIKKYKESLQENELKQRNSASIYDTFSHFILILIVSIINI